MPSTSHSRGSPPTATTDAVAGATALAPPAASAASSLAASEVAAAAAGGGGSGSNDDAAGGGPLGGERRPALADGAHRDGAAARLRADAGESELEPRGRRLGDELRAEALGPLDEAHLRGEDRRQVDERRHLALRQPVRVEVDHAHA